MLQIFSIISTFPEPTTTLSTTSASASIVDGTLRTRGQWFEQIRIICTRGSGGRAGGSYRTGVSCCSDGTGASLEPLPPRVLQIFPIMSTLLEPTTTLKATTELASMVWGTLGTCGLRFARCCGGGRAGGRAGGSCCNGSTGAILEPLPPRMFKLFSRTSTLQEPTTTLSTTSEFASIVDGTLRTRGPRIRFGINFTGGSCCSGGAAFATSTWIDGCTPPCGFFFVIACIYICIPQIYIYIYIYMYPFI